MTERELTTTSYAILGLLAVQPWSTYELAKQMRRNLHYLWPRAESNVYAEPKRLAAAGLAKARSEPTGLRRRTVYSITPKGQRLLSRWLAEPAAPARLESESLVKVAFAPSGSKLDLVNTLRRFRAEVEDKQRELRAIFEEYLRGDDPFPERVHVNVVSYRLLWEYTRTEARWADWALGEVERWPDVAAPHDRPRLIALLEDSMAR
jgi:DNA-binding PadR family transcriptional regulator